MTTQDKALQQLFKAFKKADKQLFKVGGCVRDMIIGANPKDIDLVSNALPEQIKQICLTIPGWKVLEIGEAFGIIFVVSPDGPEFEIASFRTDGTGRKPEVQLGVTIEDDVQRRDFTINALFEDGEGNVVDLVGGIKDIKGKLIRCVGEPCMRFSDDPLRKVRAIRFAVQKGFRIEHATLDAIKDNPTLDGVSKERIVAELSKIQFGRFNQVLKLVQQTGLGPAMFGIELPIEQPGQLNTLEEFFAWIFKDQSGKWLNKLEVNMKIPSQIANRVRILISLDKDFNVRSTAKKVQMDSEFFEQLHSIKVGKLLKFQPETTAEELMSQGIKGRELGEKLQEFDLLTFKSL